MQAVTLTLALGQLNSRVLCSCLEQCSHPPHWPCDQWHLANSDLMPASYTSRQSSYPCRHPTCWALWQGVALSLACCAMEAWTSALHSVHTCPPGGNARHLKLRHTFVPAAQQLISSSEDNNRSVAHSADQWWNAEWLENTRRLHTSIPNIGTQPFGMALPRPAWIWLNSLYWCWTFLLLLTQTGYGPICGLWV